ncbi:hypothetical protein DYB32_001512 [Aphanomyces invadans]|uniref:Uncharacterized protein n=1 Tax=Aphanomyces invadans TaxID=157072 RepID=A0A3R6ZVC2_9STRA|nr:hypothetical protein DYB32_001512 [Aphanomyces invadans]
MDIPTLGQYARRKSHEGPRSNIWATAAGLLYLVLTAATSVGFLYLARPTLENDMFWRDFSTLGAQVYLLNAVNREVGYGRRSSDVDFIGPVNWASIQQRYDPTASVEVKPTAPRLVALADPTMHTIEAAIVALQSLDAFYSLFLLSQFCWVDFEKRWELAHTSARAKRCLDQPFYHKNAAAYLESMLRNVAWESFVQTWASYFNSGIVPYVNSTADGPAWFRRTANAFQDVPTEAAFWRSYGLDHHRINWGNRYQAAMTDTVVIENALGLTQSLTLSRIPVTARGNLWTSNTLYWAFVNDLWYANSQGKSSAVRQAPNYVGKLNPTIHENFFSQTPMTAFLHHFVGPVLSIDAALVAPPSSLMQLVAEFEHALVVLLSKHDDASNAFHTIPIEALDPVPTSWHPNQLGHATYFGGSPLCIFNGGTPFVQPQFSFDDSCSSEVPSTLRAAPASLVFSIACLGVTGPSIAISESCAACNSTFGHCKASMASAVQWTSVYASLLPDMNSLIRAAMADIVAQEITLVQFAAVEGDNVMLQHPILANQTSHFDLFGWTMLMEWAQGYRECVKFHGDTNSHTMLSERVMVMDMRPSPLEVPAFSCVYLWYIGVSTSAVIVGLIVVALVYVGIERLHHTLQWRHLFVFNRVAGPVWIGRPMLLIRALIALIVLSTAPLDFVGNGGSRFELRPRHWVSSWIIAGEATWLTYVASDILLVLANPEASKWSAPMSSTMVWVFTFAIDVASPVTLRSKLGRHCTRVNVDQEVTCVSGVIAIGDVRRLYGILCVNAACLVTCYLGVALVLRCRKQTTPMVSSIGIDVGGKSDRNVPYSIYASGATFLSCTFASTWTVSSPIAVLCGLLPFTFQGRGYVFDIKLWTVFNAVDTAQAEEDVTLFRSFYVLRRASTVAAIDKEQGWTDSQGIRPRATTGASTARSQLLLAVGIIYVVASLMGSYSYLIVAKGRLSNDFWWEHFNSSGTHTFLANWFNQQLLYMTNQVQIDGIPLHDPKFSVMGTFGSGKEVVSSSILYPRLVMGIEVGGALAVAIDGLRRTNPCLVPWIATQHCWLDFEKRWEMATSAARQNRCVESMATNGAVYVESFLRNTAWESFSTCWGAAFYTSIGQDLLMDVTGRAWFRSIQTSPSTSIVEEVSVWRRHGLDSFHTQWQNFKTIGLVDMFNVQNSFGLTFPLSLKASNGSFRLSAQTSLKMHWTWAGDLTATISPSSSLVNCSLLRSSSRFAFANTTMEQALLTNASFLQAPLSRAYQIFHDAIGPFGSVDLYHVPIPPSLALLNKVVIEMASAVLAVASNETTTEASFPAQIALAKVPSMTQLAAVPPEWNATVYRSQGGNILCNDSPGTGIDMGAVLAAFTGIDSTCNSAIGDRIYLSKLQQAFALTGAGLVSGFVEGMKKGERDDDLSLQLVRPFCSVEKVAPAMCATSFAGILRWTAVYTALHSMDALTSDALDDLYRLNIEIMQYGRNVMTKAMTMLRRPIFKRSVNDPYALAAWGLMSEWVQGCREVFSVQGDVGSITLVTARSVPATSMMNPMEVPVNVALYVRTICLYITGVLFTVMSLVMALAVRCRFRVEGANFFKLNRVAGIAWIGRPLLLLRGMSALCLLSTGSLQLVGLGGMTTLVSSTPPWYTVVLASGEVGWVVYVINDLTTPYTKHLTPHFTNFVGLASWAAAAVISLVRPVSPSATLHRDCSVVQIDMQLVCVCGTVYIGDVSRFTTLVGIAVGLSVAGVLATRVHHRGQRRTPKSLGKPSHLLPAGANYLFMRHDWMHHNTFFIDLASAAAAGLLVVQYQSHHYVLDIKTWRTLVVPTCHDGLANHPNGPSLRYALPLVK